jgi:hypothetical protein
VAVVYADRLVTLAAAVPAAKPVADNATAHTASAGPASPTSGTSAAGPNAASGRCESPNRITSATATARHPRATESGKKPPELKLKNTTSTAGAQRSAAMAVRRITLSAAASAPRAQTTSAPDNSTMTTRSTAPSAPALLIRPYAPSPATTTSGSARRSRAVVLGKTLNVSGLSVGDGHGARAAGRGPSGRGRRGATVSERVGGGADESFVAASVPERRVTAGRSSSVDLPPPPFTRASGRAQHP